MLRSIESIFIIFTLVHYFADWVALIMSGGASEGDTFLGYDSINLGLNVLLSFSSYLWAVFFLLFRWKNTLFYATKNVTIWPLLAVAVASLLWSYNPEQTLKNCINLFGVTLFGFYVGSNYSIKEQLKLLVVSYIIIFFSSLFFIIGLPRYGIMGGVHAGAWRGIFTHKNGFGRAVALGITLLLISTDIWLNQRKITYCLLGLSMLTLLMTRSTTSLLVGIILLFGLFLYRIFRLKYPYMFLSLLSIILLIPLLYFLYLQNADNFFELIGKDPTLTGRTEIWLFVNKMIQNRFWLGYGLGGFWSNLDGPSAYIVRALAWDVPYSHNGWLDLWLDLGLLGVLVVSIGMSVNLVHAIRWARVSSGLSGLWPLVLITWILISTVSEGGLTGGFIWISYVACSFGMCRDRKSVV